MLVALWARWKKNEEEEEEAEKYTLDISIGTDYGEMIVPLIR